MRNSVRFLIILGLAILMGQPVLAAPGDTVKSVATPACCPQGLTFDGTYLWNVDRRTDMIYQIDPANGAIRDSIPSPGYKPRGLTWDGTRLWVVDVEEGLIYAINPKTRIVEQTISCPVSDPGDLAWDGKYLWIADDGGDKLDQISSEDGTTIRSLKAPTSHPGGLTFDGTYLWVSDRFQDMIYMMTATDGDVVISFPSPGPHSWGLAWDGQNVWNADYQNDRIYELVVDDGTPFTRTEEKDEQIDFVHQVRNFGPDSVKTLDVYLAIPENLNNQQLVGEITYEPQPKDFLTDMWGQKVAHFQFADLGSSQFATAKLSTSAKLFRVRYFVFPSKVGALRDIPKKITDTYLVNDSKFSYDDPVIQEAVKGAVGDETNPYWIARRIFNYVIEHMDYELAGGWNIAPAVLDRGNGSCSEYTFVYIAMCRAAGVPARYAGAVTVRNDDASTDDVYHRWVEVYLPNYGWIPVDPSGGDSSWPADRANAFGFLNNRYLITTVGGGGSEYLGWSYNSNEKWTSKGRCKIVVENFGDWSPMNTSAK